MLYPNLLFIPPLIFLMTFFLKAEIFRLALWTSLLLPIGIETCAYPFIAANHHFLAIYLSLFYLIFYFMKKEIQTQDYLKNGIKLIFALVLLLSILQKLLDGSYLDGTFFGYMVSFGSFKTDLGVDIEVIRRNNSMIDVLMALDPLKKTTHFVQLPFEEKYYGMSMRFVSFIALILESFLVLSILNIKCRKYFFVGFIGFVLLLTPIFSEAHFFGILTCFAYSLHSENLLGFGLKKLLLLGCMVFFLFIANT